VRYTSVCMACIQSHRGRVVFQRARRFDELGTGMHIEVTRGSLVASVTDDELVPHPGTPCCGTQRCVRDVVDDALELSGSCLVSVKAVGRGCCVQCSVQEGYTIQRYA